MLMSRIDRQPSVRQRRPGASRRPRPRISQCGVGTSNLARWGRGADRAAGRLHAEVRLRGTRAGANRIINMQASIAELSCLREVVGSGLCPLEVSDIVMLFDQRSYYFLGRGGRVGLC